MCDSEHLPDFSGLLIEALAEGVQSSAKVRESNLRTHIWWAAKDLVGEVKTEWEQVVKLVGEQVAINLAYKFIVDPTSIRKQKNEGSVPSD